MAFTASERPNQGVVVDPDGRQVVVLGDSAGRFANVVNMADGAGNGNSGVLVSSYGFVYNGATWDRMRSGAGIGSIRSELYIGSVPSPATDDSDGRSTFPALSLLGVGAHVFVYNGSTRDRIRAQSSANIAAAQSATGSQIVTGPGNWTISSAVAANTQATASKAAGGAGVRHVATSISASLASGSTAITVPATPVLVVIRDGATGAGTIIWQAYLSAITTAGSACRLDLTGLNVFGSANVAMTVEFNAAGGVGSFESVSLAGYSVS